MQPAPRVGVVGLPVRARLAQDVEVAAADLLGRLGESRIVASTPSAIVLIGDATIFVGMYVDGCRQVAITPVPASSSVRSNVKRICASLLWQYAWTPS